MITGERGAVNAPRGLRSGGGWAFFGLMATDLETKTGPARYSMQSNLIVFRKVMQGDIAQATYNEKIEAVFEAQRACAMVAAAVAAQPVPLADVALLLPIQVRMVQAIGKMHGHAIDKGSVRELLDIYGLGIAAQLALISASKLIPGIGSLAAPSVAYAMTLAIGELADHFVQHGRGVLPRPLTAAWLQDKNVKQTFQKLVRRRRDEFVQIAKQDGGLPEKLEQLRIAYTKDLMSEDEYKKMKSEVLSAFSTRTA